MYFKHINNQGYWGPITSSVDWCEPNYVHSYYIAETINTLSSFSMVLIGLLGSKLNYSTNWKQVYSFHLISIIGYGSILFHMTLKYYTQMLDELPMLWTSSMIFSLSLETQFIKCPTFIVPLISLYTILATVITAGLQGSLQANIFRLLFTLTTYTCILLGFRQYLMFERNTVLGKIFTRGFALSVIAFLFWILDNRGCYLFQNNNIYPIFHGAWHIIISLSTYHLIIYSNYLHQNRFKTIISKIQFKYGIPFIVKI